jgi:hypothetical protein
MKDLPPIVATLVLVAAAVVFLVGFSRHGIDFIRHGFKQIALDASLEKRFDSLDARIGGLQTNIESIEVNHFGHLKNFLTELTSILLDKGIINNENKARLDNHLRGM